MIFEVYIPRIINNFYIYSNILGIINYLWVGKRETYFQNTSPRLLLYFYSWFVSRTSWLFFFTKKKRQRKREKIPISIPKLLSIVLQCVADFLQDFERNLNISSGSRDIGSRNSRTDTSPTSAFVPCSCVSREKKKKGKEERGQKIEKRRRKIALHVTFWQIYTTYLWKIHVSRANLRRKFYFILFTYFLFILNWIIEWEKIVLIVESKRNT